LSPLRTRKLRPTLFTLLVTGPALALMGIAVAAGATSVSAAAQPAGVAGPAHVAGISAAASADSAVNTPIVLVSTTKPLAAPAPAAGLSPQNAPIDGKPAKHKPDARKHHARKHKHHARRRHHRHLGPHATARSMLRHFGWSHRQFKYLSELWNRESSWNVYAANPYSGAYGIPQAVPGSKMASAGPKWRTEARTQIRWGMRYIRARYGSPRRAWYHEMDTGWY
jgi:peptidoglycan DL-endopeptidase CwlO